MTAQPEALALADILDQSVLQAYADAAAELRRLHESNTELLEFVKDFVNIIEKHGGIKGSEKTIAAIARAAIAKAERTTP